MKGDDLAATPSASLTPGLGGQEYLMSIDWAGTAYTVIVDTGSSDTWLIQSGFQCVNVDGAPQAESACDFGPPFSGTFDDGTISDENFNITYGDGEFVTGIMGYEDITVAGLTVTKQEAALGTEAYWVGDSTSSGLMGLAYESLTSAYSGTNPADDSSADRDEYSPIFQTMVSEGLTSASFSLAIERGTGGYIAFGGLPPVTLSDATFTSTPIEYLSLSSINGYTFYVINAGITYGSSTSSTSQYIVDSGTTLIYTPTALAIAINSAFKPAARYLEDEGAYFVSCSATPPTFAVDIAGTSFTVDPSDLIYQDVTDPNTGLCLTGVQDGGSGPYILGDVSQFQYAASDDESERTTSILSPSLPVPFAYLMRSG